MKDKGQVIVIVLLSCAFLMLFLAVTIGIGQTVNARIKMQNAVDAAALSGAIWQARGLNVISDLNYVLLAAAGGDILRALLTGAIDLQLYNATLQAQKIAAKTFPGAAGLGYRQVFKENIENAECLPAGNILKMFSLRVKRKEINIPLLGKVELWMEKDREYWNDQNKKGPFIRLMAVMQKQEFIFAGDLIGLNVPKIITLAQAAPYVENEYVSMGCIFGGGLWNPEFDAKLVPVSLPIPGLLH